MPFDNTQTALISLDGLNSSDFASLCELLPKTAPHLLAGSLSRLDAGLLTSAQAIWGELLTGRPWYINGCPGHASPWKTLNLTKPVTEADLTGPIKLLDEETRQLVINVPLLLPNKVERTWLSDGSMPLPVTVSPASLASEWPFSDYKPRPSSSLIKLLAYPKDWIPECIASERLRLECTRQLLRDCDWESCVIRLSLFDQLSHILGIGYLTDNDLLFAEPIRDFIMFLDQWMADLFANVLDVAVISAFSHTTCHARINLNSLLSEGGFLSFGKADVANRHRLAALAVMSGDGIDDEHNVEVPPVPRSVLPYTRKSCQQTQFDTTRTIAASPILGCIYLNAADRFQDGNVADNQAQKIRAEIQAYLDKKLEQNDISYHLIWSANEIGAANLHRSVPDLLVYIPGAELHNSSDQSFGPTDKPRSTHCPSGFFWSMSNDKPLVMRTQDVWYTHSESKQRTAR